jgi:hypothetical protein
MIPLVGLSFFAACLTAASADLSTSEISAEMVVEADGENTHVRAILREGSADAHTFVQVSGEDKLSIDDGNRPLLLKEHSLGAYFYYTQDVSAQDAGTLFTFLFERAVDNGAPSSTVTLPDPFDITPIEETTTVSRVSDPLILTWEPASRSDPMRIDLSGACIEQVSVALDIDEGTAIFQPGSIPSLDGTSEESCKLTATLTRTRQGAPDGRWRSGSTIQASHVRHISLTLDP